MTLVNEYEVTRYVCIIFLFLAFMKISYSEIWNFIDLMARDEKGWSYELHAGKVRIKGLKQQDLFQMKNDKGYDQEILPSIFTFREIMWQPDVFKDIPQSLPPLRILKAFCEESAASMVGEKDDFHKVYKLLLTGISKNCQKAINKLEKTKNKDRVPSILGEFRTYSFPIIKFFIYHPKNRLDHHRDAVNRLNYAVKIMLTEYFGKYTALEDPYWKVDFAKPLATKQKHSE